MGKDNSLRDELLQATSKLLTLLESIKQLPGPVDNVFRDWESTCKNIKKQMAEEIIRVAVIGPIKSGKSTFVNSLFKGDHLKRGAGVVTSIVTRIRSGTCLEAELQFKSWDEVNREIEQAIVLLPSLKQDSENDRIDIRRENDRKKLQKALDALNVEQLITNDTRNASSVLLSSYLKGYDRVIDIISSESSRIFSVNFICFK